MNLLLVNYEYPPIGGGAATATQNLARTFVAKGHRVVVLTSGLTGETGESDEDGVLVVRLEVGRTVPDRSATPELAQFATRGWLRVRRLTAEHEISAAIAFFTIPSGVVARHAGVPYVVSLRGADVPGFLPELDGSHALVGGLRRGVLSCALAVVANSNSLADLSVAADRVDALVIPNGVDTKYFRPATDPRAASGLRLLAVGRLHAQKNQGFLLRALAAIPSETRERVRLDLVGDGPEREGLEAQSRALGVARLVRFHGWLARKELRDVYLAADCFVSAAVREGLPNAALEAMACGLPLLLSEAPGHEDLIRPAETGFSFSLGATAEFARHVAWLMDEPASRSRMGARARQIAETEYSWERVADAYLALFAPEAAR